MKLFFCFAFLLLPLALFSQAKAAQAPAQQPAAPQPTQPPAAYPVDPQQSPFEEELNNLTFYRNTGGTTLFWGGMTTLAGFAASSTFLTLQGLQRIDGPTANVGITVSYSVTALSAIVTAFAFWVWYDNSNKLEDTLRLQSQYYNILDK